MTDLHKAISGALFDFAGFLTTRPKSTPFGSCEDANAAVELLQEWAGTRGLQLDEADVGRWSEALAKPAVPKVLHDFETHRYSWRKAINHLADKDDSGYWLHELRAYDHAMLAFDAYFAAAPQPKDKP